MKKITIIEDHPMVAQGVKNMVHLFWKNVSILVISSFPKTEEMIYQLMMQDVIIADIHLEGELILDDLLIQQNQQPNQKIILYTSSQPWELQLSRIDFPFWGYVQKNADLQELSDCFTTIEHEERHIQKDLIWERPVISGPNQILLTKREVEILQLIKQGKTSKEISDILFLSELTVKSHRQNMMRKFGAKNVVELLTKIK